MFQNAYQRGSHMEIYDAKVNKDKDKSYASLYRMTTPQGFSKTYDKDIKGYIYNIDGHSTKMRFPKEDKVDLCIVQPFIVFQIYLPFGSPWSLEIGIADTSKVNRRINLVSALNKIETKYFHVKVPNDIIKRGVWLNLSIDVSSFMDAWKGQSFRSIDSITIGSVCKLRRVWSMKNPLFEFSTDDDLEEQMYLQQSAYSHLKPEDIPKNFAFPPGFQYTNQLINYSRIMDNVDPKYLESVSDSIDNLKTNQHQSSVQKTINQNQTRNQMKNIASKPIKNISNNSNKKQIPDLTQDFQDKYAMGKRSDANKNSHARMDRSPTSVSTSLQQNISKFNSSTKRDTSISSSHNLDEESKYENQTKIRNRQVSKEPVRQYSKSQKPPQPQTNINSTNVQQTQQKNIPKSPINQSHKSPINSQKDLSQQSIRRQTQNNQQREPSLKKKEPTTNVSQKNNNPWFINQKQSAKKQYEDRNEEIEENLDAEYYDNYEMNEELPQTIKKKDSKPAQQKIQVSGDKSLKDATNQNRLPPTQTKEKIQTQQVQRNVKSANNIGKKASLLDPKRAKENKRVDVQKNKVKKQDGSESEGIDNANAFNSMNTDIDEESYFQLTQKFNTFSDPNQFRDIFTMSNQKQTNQEDESSRINQCHYNDFSDNEIEEDIEIDQFNSPSGIRKGGKSKLGNNNLNNNGNIHLKSTKTREHMKQDTVESRKYQTNRENRCDYSTNKNKFDDSLELPYIERNLQNNEDSYDDKYSSVKKEDQGNNNSIHNCNIYENHLNKFINISQRPFTPPFQAVVPFQSSSIVNKKNSQPVAIQNCNNIENDQNYGNGHKSSVSHKNRSQLQNNIDSEDQDQLEVIYDPVLNCYYDPNSKQYYELKS